MDIDMPGIDGFETSAQICEMRDNLNFQSIKTKICCCSAYSDTKSRLKA